VNTELFLLIVKLRFWRWNDWLTDLQNDLL